jgi:predicted acetyltransferase
MVAFMSKVINTEENDFSEVVKLINHVFGKENSSKKMDDIFPDLISKNNMEHMRIIQADGKPVSVINYIINEVNIKDCIIKAASIGAVCTHENYRCRGYANLILKDCLDKMRNEGVDLLYVSGEIGLYTKNNIHITGKMHSFNIDKKYISENNELESNSYTVIECSQEDKHHLFDFYDKESVKFIRDKQRFIELTYRTPGISVFNHTAKIFRVEANGQIQGYFICDVATTDNGDFRMEVVEYAGNRKAVLEGIIKTMLQLKPIGISGYALWSDIDMVNALDEYKIRKVTHHYPGTIRIINFTQFMQKLKPLFLQEKMLEDIEFYESEGKYIMRSGNKELVFDDDKAMHDLLFGNADEVNLKEHIIGDDTLLDKINLCLPISVPYPNNLNYI